jgi:hypothetical protein
VYTHPRFSLHRTHDVSEGTRTPLATGSGWYLNVGSAMIPQ